MTFAGTPDRVESRLVPEAGFELDTFPVSGLPRRPSAAQIRAAWRASAAPMHCLRILARRRPDVVLGGGGFVAGPMVLAARLRRIPAALTEADAHLGLANRMAAPFARRLFLAYEIPGHDGAKVRVVGRPIPVAHMGASRSEGRARFGFAADAAVVAVLGALAGARSLNELAVSAWGASGPSVLHICGERDFDALRPRVDATGLRPAAADRPLRRGARGGRPRRVARRRNRVGARGRGHARDPRPLPARDRRPPDAQRTPLRAGRGRAARARRGGRSRPGARRRAARRPGASRRDARRHARARATGRSGRHRRRARRAGAGAR